MKIIEFIYDFLCICHHHYVSRPHHHFLHHTYIYLYWSPKNAEAKKVPKTITKLCLHFKVFGVHTTFFNFTTVQDFHIDKTSIQYAKKWQRGKDEEWKQAAKVFSKLKYFFSFLHSSSNNKKPICSPIVGIHLHANSEFFTVYVNVHRKGFYTRWFSFISLLWEQTSEKFSRKQKK